MSAATPFEHSLARPELGRRIALLSHLVRLLAVLWFLWNLVNISRNLTNVWHLLSVDRNGHGPLLLGAIVLAMGSLLLTAAVFYCIWRLMGVYVRGRIFAVAAAVWMRRAGALGLGGSLASILWRRLQLLVFSGHLHPTPGDLLFALGNLVTPADLLRVLFCLYVLALGQIFKAAAEIAEDNARIV
ncbi:MAG TPA: DUF2975 domain-containing protein [Xanthobacteraceae bacterium]|jgi:hypothetical protein